MGFNSSALRQYLKGPNMTLAVIADTLEDAVNEAKAYNRMGGLDDQVLLDIAHDYDVDISKLKKAMEET